MSESEQPAPQVEKSKAGFGTGVGFGTTQDPRAAQLKAAESRKNGHSIRLEIRKLLHEGFQIGDVDKLEELLQDLLRKGELRRAVAVKALCHMLLKPDEVRGSRDSLNWFIEQVEGVLPTTAVSATANVSLDNDDATGEAFKQSLLRGLNQIINSGAAPDSSQPADTSGANPAKV